MQIAIQRQSQMQPHQPKKNKPPYPLKSGPPPSRGTETKNGPFLKLEICPHTFVNVELT